MHGCLQLLKCIKKSPVVRDGLRHLLTYTYDPIRSRVKSGAGFVYIITHAFLIFKYGTIHAYIYTKAIPLIQFLLRVFFMQIQIGIDIVLILAFLAYLSVVTGWNSKNKAAYIKQFRHVPISLLFKEIRYMYFISMACVLITIILVDWRIYNVASYFDALSVSLWIFIIYFTIFSTYQIGTAILVKLLMIFSNRATS